MRMRFPIMPVWGSFPPGTHVQTNQGERAVEELSPGDRIQTDKGENATLRQISCHKQTLPGKRNRGKPILIKAGVLGGGLPVRDLILAPGQRLALADFEPVDLLESADLLVPAAGLCDLAGVRRMKGRRQMTFFSLIFDAPRLIRVEGCLVESCQPTLSRLANEVTLGWAGVIGNRFKQEFWPRALSVWQTRRQAAGLCASGDLPEYSVHQREHDLLEWDRDLDEEKQVAAAARRGAA